MKKKYAVLQLVVLVTLAMGVVFSLLLSQFGVRQRHAPDLEISVVLREDESESWSYTRLGMEQAAADFGSELRIITPSVRNDDQGQLELLQWEVNRGTDAIIVVPVDVTMLKEQFVTDVPIVAVESPLDGSHVSVLSDNYSMGWLLAQTLAEEWITGTVVILNVSEMNLGISERLKGAQEFLEQEGIPCRVVTAEVEHLDEQLPALLGSDCRWVLAMERTATELMIEAKESDNLPVELYGMGITARITAGLERGTLKAVVATSDYASGYLAVEKAIELAQRNAAVSETLPHFLVRKEDLYETEMQKILFPVDS